MAPDPTSTDLQAMVEAANKRNQEAAEEAGDIDDNSAEAANFEHVVGSSVALLKAALLKSLESSQVSTFAEQVEPLMKKLEAQSMGLVETEFSDIEMGTTPEELQDSSKCNSALVRVATDSQDETGCGLFASKAIEKWDLVYDDKCLLNFPVHDQFTPEICDKWFHQELSDDDREEVLALKRFAGHEDLKALADLRLEAIAKAFPAMLRDDIMKVLDLAGVGEEDDTVCREKLENVTNLIAEGDETGLKENKDAFMAYQDTLSAYAAVRTNSISSDGFRILCPVLSRTNHSCKPNVWQREGKLYALRDIQAREELCWSYPQGMVSMSEITKQECSRHFLFAVSEQRRKHLLAKYSFNCACSRCAQSESAKDRNQLEHMQEEFESFQEACEKSGSCISGSTKPLEGKPPPGQSGSTLDGKDWDRFYLCSEKLEQVMESSEVLCLRLSLEIKQFAGVFSSYRLVRHCDLGLDYETAGESDLKTINLEKHLQTEYGAFSADIDAVIECYKEALRASYVAYGASAGVVLTTRARLAFLLKARLMRQYAKAMFGRNTKSRMRDGPTEGYA